jgi:hypothetical protein
MWARFGPGWRRRVVAGLIAARFGSVVGGLFLAFPAILRASATLVERRVRERKAKADEDGLPHCRKAAACDAVGAALGSFGLAAFAAVVWLTVGPYGGWSLLYATAA